ncbi:MAG: Gfo/Idh/MocA family oxidoreductase [Pirellulaceae bacterium]
MSNRKSRREFMGQSAALGAGVWLGTSVASRSHASPLQGLSAACVGVGGKGSSDTSHIAEQGVNIVGLCDVDKGTLTKKGREFESAQQFQDFREMLDKLGDKVDIVTVSTPDHTHACAAMQAMKLKKHVYCQKPLTWSIAEARLLSETAKKMGVVTQMGNQGTSENGLREAVEVIRSGVIGDVKQVHVWTNRPIWPQGEGRPAGTDPVPADLNWDAWIGPAPMRPFKEKIYHSFNWRGWLDFGTGALGDMACHTTNMPVMAINFLGSIAVTAVRTQGLSTTNSSHRRRASNSSSQSARMKRPLPTFTGTTGATCRPTKSSSNCLRDSNSVSLTGAPARQIEKPAVRCWSEPKESSSRRTTTVRNTT